MAKENKPYQWVLKELEKIEELEYLDFDPYMLELLGLNASLDSKNNLALNSKTNKIKNEIFCVVDIESNNSFKNGGQIIEIGAVKIQNGKEIASFESFIKTDDLPQNISDLTGISLKMLKNAPSLASTLNKFRLFLGNHTFVAHNARFDYEFISNSLHSCGFGILLNQRLCTIDLAKRIIPSERYGLDSLKELLDIKTPHHRALSDARAAGAILNHCIAKLPFYLKSTQELLNFSKTNNVPTQKKTFT